jgi:hypothetical protein
MKRLHLEHVPLASFTLGDLVWARARSADPFWPVRRRHATARNALSFTRVSCARACVMRVAHASGAPLRAAPTPHADVARVGGAQGRIADPTCRAEVPENVAAAAQRDSLCVMFFGPSCAKARAGGRRFAACGVDVAARARARAAAAARAPRPARRRALAPRVRGFGPAGPDARAPAAPPPPRQGQKRDYAWVRAGQLYPLQEHKAVMEVRAPAAGARLGRLQAHTRRRVVRGRLTGARRPRRRRNR